MVAGSAYSGVDAGLLVELFEPVDEPLDAILIGEQVAGEWVIPSEDAPDDRIKQEHPQAIERSGAPIGLQEQHGWNGRAAQLDLARNGLDVVDPEGREIPQLGLLRRT